MNESLLSEITFLVRKQQYIGIFLKLLGIFVINHIDFFPFVTGQYLVAAYLWQCHIWMRWKLKESRVARCKIFCNVGNSSKEGKLNDILHYFCQAVLWYYINCSNNDPCSAEPELEGASINLFSSTSNNFVSSNQQARLISVEDDVAESSSSSIISFVEHRVLIGNRKWIKEKNFIDIPTDIEEKMISQENLGHTALLAAIDGKYQTVLVVVQSGLWVGDKFRLNLHVLRTRIHKNGDRYPKEK